MAWLFAPIGSMLGVGTAAGAAGATAASVSAATVAGMAATSAAVAGGVLLSQDKKTPTLPGIQSPFQDVSEEKKKDKIRQGRTMRRTLLTGPQGLIGNEPTVKKELLGE